MGREVEADRVELLAQPLHRIPVGDGRQRRRAELTAGRAAEQPDLAALPAPPPRCGRSAAACRRRQPRGRGSCRSIEGPGPGQVLQLALVQELDVEPPGQVEQVLKGPPRSRSATRLRIASGPTLDRAEGVANGLAAVGQRLDREHRLRLVMSGISSLMRRRVSSCRKTFSCRCCRGRASSNSARNSTGWFAFRYAVW